MSIKLPHFADSVANNAIAEILINGSPLAGGIGLSCHEYGTIRVVLIDDDTDYVVLISVRCSLNQYMHAVSDSNGQIMVECHSYNPHGGAHTIRRYLNRIENERYQFVTLDYIPPQWGETVPCVEAIA